jgi:hypothetical protein
MPTHNHYQLIYCREQERNGEERRGMERNGEERRGMERNGEEWRGMERNGVEHVGMFPLSFISPLFSFPLPFYFIQNILKQRGKVKSIWIHLLSLNFFRFFFLDYHPNP